MQYTIKYWQKESFALIKFATKFAITPGYILEKSANKVPAFSHRQEWSKLSMYIRKQLKTRNSSQYFQKWWNNDTHKYCRKTDWKEGATPIELCIQSASLLHQKKGSFLKNRQIALSCSVLFIKSMKAPNTSKANHKKQKNSWKRWLFFEQNFNFCQLYFDKFLLSALSSTSAAACISCEKW